MGLNEDDLPWDALKIRLQELPGSVERGEYSRVWQLLLGIVGGCSPDGEIVDRIDLERGIDS